MEILIICIFLSVWLQGTNICIKICTYIYVCLNFLIFSICTFIFTSRQRFIFLYRILFVHLLFFTSILVSFFSMLQIYLFFIYINKLKFNLKQVAVLKHKSTYIFRPFSDNY